nr:MAG TPA: hypothetical protein [Caudoviricetes sp.]DAT59463.1 MAG TPA: hypothetical protein [Caudoviricetes sp.]DAY93438.1 MAG TPA: hypothetical protein [Caudoviricetes sp.]
MLVSEILFSCYNTLILFLFLFMQYSTVDS